MRVQAHILLTDLEIPMRIKLFLAGLVTAVVLPIFAAEEITFSYTYEGNHGVDFSNMRNGPLKLGNFSDGRSVENPNIITNDLDGYSADKALTDIVKDALAQGLAKGGAALVDEGEAMTLQGSIVSSEAQIVESNGLESIRLTIRTNVELTNGSRTIWNTVLFGRGTATVDEGMEQALKNAMDRTISGLVRDTYFQIEVL